MTNTPHASPVFLQEANARSQHASHIVTGFSRATPALADLWQQLQHALSDTPILTAEVTRLAAEIGAVRLDRANLAAAAFATLTAYHAAEPDPLSYLRDELTAQGFTWGRA